MPQRLYIIDLGWAVVDDPAYLIVADHQWYWKEDKQLGTIVNNKEILMTQLLNDEYGEESRE